MAHAPIRLMKDRRREMIPVDKIRVINSRTRDEGQFALNVQSIDAIGQIKDIRVNDKFLARDGFYELICGDPLRELRPRQPHYIERGKSGKLVSDWNLVVPRSLAERSWEEVA